jgi:uncharacterized alpha-E superfamily protein
MLSRTANAVFWIARYMERMDFVARLLDAGQRMAGVSADANEWRSTLVAAGCEDSFPDRHPERSAQAVIDFLIRDPTNPSSVRSCIDAARHNARSVRTALTVDMWEAINVTWHEGHRLRQEDFEPVRIGGTLDWIKSRAVLFNGAYTNTMLRNDAFYFARLGTFVERADNTARILDVKYHVLLPEPGRVGSGLDYHHWSAILRAVSALRSYHWIYRDRIQPWNVAELLILRPEMPRSMRACYDQIVDHLRLLEGAYGGRSGECHRLAGELHARLRYGRIQRIFQHGLHEFLTAFIDDTAVLGGEIEAFYMA